MINFMNNREIVQNLVWRVLAVKVRDQMCEALINGFWRAAKKRSRNVNHLSPAMYPREKIRPLMVKPNLVG